ncbi:carcinoembryonic antigen-related cell adhesion molecule 19-like [Pelobates fuscus]|uniref:carcinoembryonic antigen-related cell adhesion molecule 19-like n=1 Tax=Pelobates fuscus TaxID=191477 RepID=UPI002FE4F862
MFCKMCIRVFPGFLPIVFLGLLVTQTAGIDIQLIPKEPKVSDNVILNVIGVSGTIRSFTWYKGTSPSAPSQILNFIPSLPNPQTEGAQYFPEASGLANGSLLIRNLSGKIAGEYTVQIQTDTLQQQSVKLAVNGNVSIGVTLSFYSLLILSQVVIFI